MLSAAERRQIDAALEHYATRSSGAATALKIVQSHRRWLPDEALSDVAAHLGVSVADLEQLTTFYNGLYRYPVGRHVVLLCDSFACWELGYDEIRAHLEGRLGVPLGGTTGDDRFTLLPIVCLGACDVGPAMMVDGTLHGDLTPERVDEILELYP